MGGHCGGEEGRGGVGRSGRGRGRGAIEDLKVEVED